MQGDKRPYWLLCIGLMVALYLAIDGKHHWHEVRFLYATSQFSMDQILSGVFNPEQAGGIIDEIGSGGFYAGKMLHLWLLKTLFRQFDPAEGGFSIAVGLSMFLVACSVVVAYGIFRRLFSDHRKAVLATACVLLMPITPYLAGKLLSEVTAMFFVSISIWSFLRLNADQGKSFFPMAIVGGLFLLLAGLSRIDSVVSFGGLWAALLIVAKTRKERCQILYSGFCSVAIFVLGYIAVIALIGIKAEHLARYFVAFVSGEQKPAFMSLVGIATFGGVVYLFALKGLLSRKIEHVPLLAIWLATCGGLALLVTYNYMVEPRYLVNTILPLAGLAAIGIDVILKRVGLMNGRLLTAGAVVIISLINIPSIRLMPYELDRPSLVAAVEKITEQDSKATILVPWAYTDFHFLRVMKPELKDNLYNVNSDNGELTPVESLWQQRFRKWYGKNYLIDPAGLDTLVADGPTYYVGWKRYPPVEQLSQFVGYLGSSKLLALFEGIRLRNHLAASWIWNNENYSLIMAGKVGQYEYYKVKSNVRAGVSPRLVGENL
jgi:hypothetical protein